MKRNNQKVFMVLLLYCLFYSTAHAQNSQIGFEETLRQTAEVLNRQSSKSLWGISLNAPLIVIDQMNNKIYLTAIEDGKVQTPKEETWDNKVSLANSITEYEGKRYSTALYSSLINGPLEGRINLIAHEIFHLHQKDLGITNYSSKNYHMDEAEGRTLLQMEMKALQGALDGDTITLRDALYIRAVRQNLYPDNNEDLYELNEGLAEYTGTKIASTNLKDIIKEKLDYDISRGYTHAFAYATGATYAMILDSIYPDWKQDKELSTQGMIFLIKKVKPQYKINLDKTATDKIFTKYNHSQILTKEETELNSFGDINQFKALLLPQTPKLIIENQEINYTYNPNDRVIDLGNAVLLRNITLTGNWGKAKVTSGIIRLKNWGAFYLLPPTRIDGDTIQGEGYKLTLNKGWKVSDQLKIEKE